MQNSSSFVMQPLRILGIFLMLVTAISCSKDDSSTPNNNNGNGCTPPAAPTVGSNTPVSIGGTINLTASSVTGATGYSWTGPNGFSSSLQNPTITSATSSNSGTYTVTVTVAGGCTSSASTNVAVNVTAPCNPTNNQYTLVGIPAVSFTPLAIQFGVGTSGNYEITCNGSNGDIHLEFAIPSKPTPGIYNVTQLGPLAPADEVKISNTTFNAYWSTSSGLLYVTDAGNGKNVYTYCSLTFSNSTFGTSASGSGKITEP